MNAPQLLTLKQVCERLGVSRWTLEDLRNSGIFPSPVYLPPKTRKSIRWIESEVNEFIAKLAAERTA